MITLTWVESEIEKAVHEGNHPKNIYDLAALLTVRDFLRASSDPDQKSNADQRPPQAYSHKPDPDILYTRPTLDQIDEALSAVAIDTPEEAQRARDIKTWADILRR